MITGLFLSISSMLMSVISSPARGSGDAVVYLSCHTGLHHKVCPNLIGNLMGVVQLHVFVSTVL